MEFEIVDYEMKGAVNMLVITLFSVIIILVFLYCIYSLKKGYPIKRLCFGNRNGFNIEFTSSKEICDDVRTLEEKNSLEAKDYTRF